MTTLKVCQKVKIGVEFISSRSTLDKNKMLGVIADALVRYSDAIVKANVIDLSNASDKASHFIDRLKLDKKRIEDAATGLRQLIDLADPVGEIIDDWTATSGIKIKKVRVPLGVVGIIYEARPLVTVDAVGLCLKTGNAIVLRGSKDAIESNKAIVAVMTSALANAKFNSDFIGLIEDTSRDSAKQLMQAREFVDVLIPRGSAALINEVVNSSSVPVIETGAGNCHCYVEASADLKMATDIIKNGKLSRPSVCNALESLLIDKAIAKSFLPSIVQVLASSGVEVVGCNKTRAICSSVAPAIDDDFYKEFLALKIAIKIVDGVNEAIAHINKHSTRHSEVIISTNSVAIEKFFNLVDSAAVYANASTRFTDGFEFGFGAEMGISTQKLHARGPMGLKELTSQKYKVYGTGQVR